MSTNNYTVSQVSRLAHVTVRALHHYDAIGLLVPSQRSEKGYRQYSDADLRRLQQILVFKQLGFSLEAIQAVIDEPAAQRRHALLTQRAQLAAEARRTAAVIRAIEHALQTLEGATNMDSNEIFDGFDQFDHARYADEARERWGDTDAYQESARRAKSYSKEDWARIKDEVNAINARMAELMQAGRTAADPEVRQAAEEHRLHIDRWFYPCSHEFQVTLGEMYVADPRFGQTYDSQAPGLAKFMRDAIVANAREHGD